MKRIYFNAINNIPKREYNTIPGPETTFLKSAVFEDDSDWRFAYGDPYADPGSSYRVHHLNESEVKTREAHVSFTKDKTQILIDYLEWDKNYYRFTHKTDLIPKTADFMHKDWAEMIYAHSTEQKIYINDLELIKTLKGVRSVNCTYFNRGYEHDFTMLSAQFCDETKRMLKKFKYHIEYGNLNLNHIKNTIQNFSLIFYTDPVLWGFEYKTGILSSYFGHLNLNSKFEILKALNDFEEALTPEDLPGIVFTE